MASLNESVGLLFRIKADSSQAVQEYNKFKKHFEDTTADLKKEYSKFQKDFENTTNDLKNKGSVLTQVFQGLTSELGYTGEEAAIMARNAEGLGSALKGVGIAAGVVTGAIAAMGLAAIGAGAAIFELTKHTAEFGTEIFHAKETTGLSAETLSSLKFAAGQAGISFEQVNSGLSSFAKLIGDATGGSKKAIAEMQTLSVTSTDLNVALSQALATIIKTPDGTQQMTTAMAAFGAELGPKLIPFIKEFDGNLPRLIAKCKELGVTMTDENVRASSEFTRTLNLLTQQAAAVGRQFALQLMPDITQAMRIISRSLADNRNVVNQWATNIKNAIYGIIGFYRDLENAIARAKAVTKDYQDSASPGRYDPNSNLNLLGVLQRRGQQEINSSPLLGDAGGDVGIVEGGTAGTLGNVKGPKGGGGRAKSGANDAAREAEQAAQADLQAQIKYQELMLSNLKEGFAKTLDTIREDFKKTGDEAAFSTASQAALDNFKGNATIVVTELQRLQTVDAGKETANQTKLRVAEQKKQLEDLNDYQKEAADKNNELIVDKAKKLKADQIKIEKELTDELIKINQERQNQFIAAQQDTWDQLIDDAQGNLEEQNRLRGEALKQFIGAPYEGIIGLYDIEETRQKAALEEEKARRKQNILDTLFDEETKLKLLKELDEIYQQEELLSTEEFQKKRDAIIAKYSQGAKAPAAPKTNLLGDILGTSILDTGKVDDAGNHINDFTGAMKAMGDIGHEAFSQLAKGVGSMVENIVLLGTAGPGAFKKLVASVLAGVAAQAAVLAVMELAYGIAALTPWGAAIYGPAPLHFKAAALFGSIAVVSGLAGRGVAGDSFNGKDAGASQGTAANQQPQNNNFSTPFAGFNQGNQQGQGQQPPPGQQITGIQKPDHFGSDDFKLKYGPQNAQSTLPQPQAAQSFTAPQLPEAFLNAIMPANFTAQISDSLNDLAAKIVPPQVNLSSVFQQPTLAPVGNFSNGQIDYTKVMADHNALLSRVNLTMGQLEETTHTLHSQITSLSPGDMLRIAADQAPDAIHTASIGEITSSPAKAGDYLRGLGL